MRNVTNPCHETEFPRKLAFPNPQFGTEEKICADVEAAGDDNVAMDHGNRLYGVMDVGFQSSSSGRGSVTECKRRGRIPVRPFVWLLFVAVIAVMAVSMRLPAGKTKTICEVTTAMGIKLRVYLKSDGDIAFLGLESKSVRDEPGYYWIAASPNSEFGALKLRVDLSMDGKMFWVEGSSRKAPAIDAAFDIANRRFYTKDGLARDASKTPDMEMMDFESAPFPARQGVTNILFNSSIEE